MRIVVLSKQLVDKTPRIELTISANIPFTAKAHDICQWLFHQFNRKDDDENELISLFGFAMPSLSMGDVVEIYYEADMTKRRLAFRCSPIGWVEITQEHYAPKQPA